MRHSDLLSREECEKELNGALNRADHLRHRGRQVLYDAENEIVELQNQSKKSMDEVEVAAAAVIDMTLQIDSLQYVASSRYSQYVESSCVTVINLNVK